MQRVFSRSTTCRLSQKSHDTYILQQRQQCHTHTHPFNSPLPGTTRVSRYQKGKTNLDFTEARDSEWQWHQLGHMQVCTSLQTGNHTSTPPLSFLQAGCPSCHVKALNINNANTNIYGNVISHHSKVTV